MNFIRTRGESTSTDRAQVVKKRQTPGNTSPPMNLCRKRWMKEDTCPVARKRYKLPKEVVYFREENGRKENHLLPYMIQQNRRLQRMEGTSFSANWSELPGELLEVILSKLPVIDDRIRFGAVCLPWRNVYRYCRTSFLPCQLPFLIYWEKGTLCLCNPFAAVRRKKLYDVGIHIPGTSHCIGSSQGWVVIEEGANRVGSVRLLNPFMSVNNEIRLPLLAGASHFRKIVLSANPASNSDYLVMAIYSAYSKLAFYRAGEESWARIPGPSTFQVNDIIYYKHNLYVVEGDGKIMVCDISSPHPVLNFVVELPRVSGHQKTYLVESSGDLLCIFRIFKWSSLSTIGCKCFKIVDPTVGIVVWNELKSLRGRILFLGGISSISVGSSDFPGCCKSNCIYFSYDSYAIFVWNTSLDTTVFNLEDGSLERLLPSKCLSPIWIEPKLQSC